MIGSPAVQTSLHRCTGTSKATTMSARLDKHTNAYHRSQSAGTCLRNPSPGSACDVAKAGNRAAARNKPLHIHASSPKPEPTNGHRP